MRRMLGGCGQREMGGDACQEGRDGFNFLEWRSLSFQDPSPLAAPDVLYLCPAQQVVVSRDTTFVHSSEPRWRGIPGSDIHLRLNDVQQRQQSCRQLMAVTADLLG